MLIKSIFGKYARLGLLCAWFFVFLLAVRFATLPLAYPQMRIEAMTGCVLVAVAMWVFLESECRTMTGKWFSPQTRVDGLILHQPWLTWFAMMGSIACAIVIVITVNQFVEPVIEKLASPSPPPYANASKAKSTR